MTNKINYPKVAGIYKLTCSINNKIYIGKSINISKRLNRHKNCNTCYTGISFFQRAVVKYGWDSFNIEILEIVNNFDKLKDNILLLERESYYINLFDSSNSEKGYNICKFSTDRTGMKHSEESKEKMRKPKAPHIRSPHSEERKSNISKTLLGRVFSDETKTKISQSKIGTVFTEEHKEKLRQAKVGKPSNRKGTKHSEESKEKMRQTRLRKRIELTLEKPDTHK